MNERTLQNMYQQWMQDNENYIHRWLDFVEFVAKQFGAQQDEVMRILQRCMWFRKGE